MRCGVTEGWTTTAATGDSFRDGGGVGVGDAGGDDGDGGDGDGGVGIGDGGDRRERGRGGEVALGQPDNQSGRVRQCPRDLDNVLRRSSISQYLGGRRKEGGREGGSGREERCAKTDRNSLMCKKQGLPSEC